MKKLKEIMVAAVAAAMVISVPVYASENDKFSDGGIAEQMEVEENTVKSWKSGKSADKARRNILRIVWGVSIKKSQHFSNSRAEKKS